MMTNFSNFRDTTNVAVPLTKDGSLTPMLLSWLKSLVHRKDLLINLIAYGRKVYIASPFYIVHHDGFVFFCFAAFDSETENFLRAHVDFIKMGPVPGFDDIDLSEFSPSASLFQDFPNN